MADAPVERSAGPRLVAALALSAMLQPLNSTMLTVVLAPIGLELLVPQSELTQLLVTSYLITSIVMQAPAGKLGDRVGHHRLLTYGQLGVAAGAGLAFFAPDALVLAAARVLMAAGGAMVVPSATALIRLELPADRRAGAFGAFGGVMALAAAIGPVLGGALEWAFDWRATFLVPLAVLPVAALLARGGAGAVRAPSARPSSRRVDVAGAVLLGVALSTVVIGARASDEARPVLFGIALVAAVLFVLWERRHPEPVVDLGLLRRPVLVAGGLVIALQNFVMYALLFELPVALERVLGVEPHTSGPVLGAMMIAMVVASPLSGRLADRLGARAVAVAGATTALAGLLVLQALPLSAVWSPIPGLVLLGLGLGVTAAPSQAASMSATPAESSGMAAALLSTMRYLGGVAGIIALGLVQSDTRVVAEALAEHTHALWLFTAALAITLGCAAVLPRRLTEDPTDLASKARR